MVDETKFRLALRSDFYAPAAEALYFHLVQMRLSNEFINKKTWQSHINDIGIKNRSKL